MPIVKLRNRNEWWTANTLQSIKNLSAKMSIDIGELIVYDEVDDLPKGLGTGDYSLVNVIIYKRATALPNAEYQRRHRKKRHTAGLRELRGVWINTFKHNYDTVKAKLQQEYH